MDPEARDPDVHNEGAERKLWFEFISKLNDRNLKKDQESGVTNWVLLGVVVAILYKGMPKVPAIVSSQEYLTATYITSLLLLDLLINFGLGYLHLVRLAEKQQELRSIPDQFMPAVRIMVLLLMAALALFGGLQIAAAFLYSGMPLSVELVLIIFGALLLLQSAIALVLETRVVVKAWNRKASLPPLNWWNLTPKPEVRIISGFAMFSVGGLVLYALIYYLKGLTGWVTALGAASQVIGLAAAISTLFFRGFRAITHGAYIRLEMEILVENLSPAEIRARFVEQLLGARITERLKQIGEDVTRAESAFEEACRNLQQELIPIETIDSKYALERRGQTAKILYRLEVAQKECRAVIDGSLFQLGECAKIPMPKAEREVLKATLAEMRRAIDQQEGGLQGEAFNELISRMKILLGIDQGNAIGATSGEG